MEPIYVTLQMGVGEVYRPFQRLMYGLDTVTSRGDW
jgi:hypothetical protein